MTSILECKDINELIKLGWSYPLKLVLVPFLILQDFISGRNMFFCRTEIRTF